MDTYKHYTYSEHTGLSERLLGAAYAHHFPQTREPEPAVPLAFETILERQRKAATFAADFYRERGVPGDALEGLMLWACRCPECRKPSS